MVVEQACNQFSGQSRLLEIGPLRETFQLQQINKMPYGEKFGAFFHPGTPKTAFLMINFSIVTRNLGIFPSKQGHSFQFPRKASPSFLVSQPRKTNFVNELMEVWRTLTTCWEVVKIWAIGTHKNFQTCSMKSFFVFKALPALILLRIRRS